MKQLSHLTAAVLMLSSAMLAADAPPSLSKVFGDDLALLEKELVPLAEAMPAEKFEWAPASGEFKGARTFGQQVSHTAATMYAVSAAVLGEKNPTDMGKNENGPATLKTKEEIVNYLKDAIAYGKKALATLTAKNMTDLVPAYWSADQKFARLAMANVAIWHSWDHYGQMAVYARMNGIVPPASRR